jgi:hypothetical protein
MESANTILNNIWDAMDAKGAPVQAAAGENHMGEVGGRTTTITVTPELTVHATYAANDYVGRSGVPLVFDGAVRVAGGTGIIQSAELIDAALQSVACELWLFDTTFTPPADSAAWTITDAEARTLIGVIPFSTYYASAANSVAVAGGMGIAFKAATGKTSIYGALVTRGAPAYTAVNDVTLRLNILCD